MEYNLDINAELKNFINKEKQYTIPIFIPHVGCPNDCVFCNQKRISGQLTETTVDDVDSKIQEYLNYYTNSDRKIEIAFFGGSFTGIDINLQEKYLEVAYKYVKEKKVDSIRLSTRPDYINEKILRLLKNYRVTTIELGVQSMDDEVLEISKRGHTSKDVKEASRLITSFGIKLGHQVMIGLPGSTLEKEVYSIKECLKLNPSQLRIYPVYVIEDSELYAMYKDSVYKPLSVEEAVKRTKAIVKECIKTEVSIIRLGLQSTDEITASNSNIFGPVVDNFAEYVMADIIRDKINNLIQSWGKLNELVIKVPKKFVSVCVGPKKINKIYFEQKHNLKYIVKGVE